MKFPPVLGPIPESLRYVSRMVLLVTAVVGGLVMTMKYEPLHLKGIGSLYTLTFAHDRGPNPGVGNLQAAYGSPNWAAS